MADVPSALATTILFCDGSNSASSALRLLPCLKTAHDSPAPAPQTLTDPSSLAVTIARPSELNATLLIQPVWPTRLRSLRPVRGSQRSTLVPSPAGARMALEGEKASARSGRWV